MKFIMGYPLDDHHPAVSPPENYRGDFRADIAAGLVGVGLIVNSEDNRGIPMLEKDYNNMSKFLNRCRKHFFSYILAQRKKIMS